MSELDESLLELAQAYGIATEYWDWQGVHVPVSATAIRAVLTALGIDADGDVEQLAEQPSALVRVAAAPLYYPPGRYDVQVQSVPVPGGGWAHLIDSSRRDGPQEEVRQSETGRRALVVCTVDLACDPPITITEAEA